MRLAKGRSAVLARPRLCEGVAFNEARTQADADPELQPFGLIPNTNHRSMELSEKCDGLVDLWYYRSTGVPCWR
jgi:hypothetical protein